MRRSRRNQSIALFPAAFCIAAIGLSATTALAQQQGDQPEQPNEQRDTQRESDAQRQAPPEPQFEDRQNRQNQQGQQDRERTEREYRDQPRQQDRQSDRQGGQDQPAGLGVTVIDGERGVRVRGVAQDSPAESAGIQPGDEILAINDQRIQSGEQLVRFVRQQDPGSQVDVRINRNGQEQTVTADLQTRQEALNLDRQQMDDSERFYRGSPPPWGDDQLRQHVTALERQVREMQREIEDLRTMLDSDPSQRSYAGADSRSGEQQFRNQQNRDQQFRDQQNRDQQFRDRSDRGEQLRNQQDREQQFRDQQDRQQPFRNERDREHNNRNQ